MLSETEDQVSNTPDRVSQMMTVQQEGLELFKRKNADYGDAFATYGTVGVLVRMGDKISRLQSITTRQVSLVDTESMRDTLIDLYNYAAMAIMLIDEDKDKDKKLKKTTSISEYFGRKHSNSQEDSVNTNATTSVP